MITDNKQAYSYLLPIIKGISGFASTLGFVLVYYDKLIIRSFDGTYLNIANILPTNIDKMFIIKDFISNPNIIDEPVYYNKYNIIKDDMMRMFNIYSPYIVEENPEVFIPDIQDNPIWSNIKNIGVYWVKEQGYKIPISKWFIPLNAKDTCNLSIYNRFDNNTILLKYTWYKKKLNLNVHTFSRQLI